MAECTEWEHHHGTIVAEVNHFTIIECEACGFKHAIPIPTAEELAGLYSARPFVGVPDAREEAWLNNTYNDRFATLEELLPGDRRTMLDAGSGAGTFLQCGQERGWQVMGVEPCSQLAEHCRQQGIPVKQGFFDSEMAGQLAPVDAVTINEVLEHIPYPAEFLETAFLLLKPGGIVSVTVANEFNPLQQAYCKLKEITPWWLVPPVHINYFDTLSLPKLLNHIGFETVLKEATFPIDLFLLMGDEYVANPALGSQCHEKRRNFELNMQAAGQNAAKRTLYRQLAEAGFGREVTVYARKP